MAASREKKSRDLSMLAGMLDKEESLLVAGFRYEGLWYVRVDPPAFSCRQRPRFFSHPGGEPSPDALPPPRLVPVSLVAETLPRFYPQ